MGFREPALNFWNGEIAMKKSKKNIASIVKDIAEPIARALGYDLWDVEYVKEGADYYLRIEIDSPDGITIDDCEKMHRAIDPILDEADPIEDSYHLEVSSCGVERELKNAEHIAACVGWQVEVRLYSAIDGSKVWTGELCGLDENLDVAIVCNADDVVRAFPQDAIASLHKVYDFEADSET